MSRSISRIAVAVSLLLAALWWTAGPVLPVRAAVVTVATCDAQALTNAIAGAPAGATVTFGCSGTIALNDFRQDPYGFQLDRNLTIDGGGQAVTIDSGGLPFVTVGIPGETSPVTVTLRNLSIVNGGNSDGGGVTNYGTLTVVNTSFSNGYQNSGSLGFGGGGIENFGGALTVIHSTFSHNHANNGGAIYAIGGGSVTVVDSTFTGNAAVGYGGGIDISGGSRLTVINSTFSGNTAGLIGGGILSDGPATVSGSTFDGNSANPVNVGSGGGILNAGSMTVVNSTFSGNSARDGGGINNEGNTTVVNSTFSGNSTNGASDFAEGGSSLYNGYGEHLNGTITLRNTILAKPLNTAFVGTNCVGNVIDKGDNVEDGTTCGLGSSSFSHVNPNLGPLANNGGPTKTFALGTTSPALFKGTCAATSPIFGVDQRGYIRSTPHCDAGAYEHKATRPFSTTSLSFTSHAGGVVVLSAAVDSAGLPHVVITTVNGTSTSNVVLGIYPGHSQIVPSGKVIFHDGSATGPVVACVEGDPVTHAVPLPETATPESVTCTTSSLAKGSHTATAVYSGDSIFATSPSYNTNSFTVS